MKKLITSVCLCVGLLFAGCRVGYKRENGRWAFISWNEGVGRQVEFVASADDGTFRQLDDPEYASDQSAVYYRSVRIEGADPRSFRHLEGFYWRDAKSVFFVNRLVIGADPGTFRPLQVYPWGQDAADAYYGTKRMFVRDVESFRLVNEYWAKDSKAYYSSEGQVSCDCGSLEFLNDSYAKDANRAFWRGVLVDGADAATFAARNDMTAYDKSHRYRQWVEYWEDIKKRESDSGAAKK